MMVNPDVDGSVVASPKFWGAKMFDFTLATVLSWDTASQSTK